MRRAEVVLVIAIALAVALPVKADFVNVYTIGSSPAGDARDPAGNNIGGVPTITWINSVSQAGPALLSIVAEGIDNNGPDGLAEIDQVLFNGSFIGDLTPQGFYSPLFNLCVATAITGPCALTIPGVGPVTGLSTSTFTVNALAGANTVEVIVDPSNFVNEIDTSSLTSVPEPGTISLICLGAVAVLLGRRRLLAKV